jgi:small conductance mechanosensitive channel
MKPPRLLLLLLAPLARGQEVQGLGDDALLQRAAAQAQALALADEAYQSERKALQSNAEDLKRAQEALAAPLPPEPTPVERLEARTEEALEREAQLWREYREAWLARQRGFEAAQAARDARRKLLASATEKLGPLAQAATALKPALDELNRRIAAGTLSRDRVNLGTPARDLESWLRRIDETGRQAVAARAEHQGELERLDAERRRPAEPAPDPAVEERLRIGTEAVALLLRAERSEAAEAEELRRLAPDELSTSLGRIAEDMRRAREEHAAAAARVEELRARLEALDRERAAVTTPDPATIPEGEGHAELKAALRELAQCDGLLQVHRRRVQLLQDARAVAADLKQASAAASRQAEEAAGRIIRLRAALSVAEALRREGKIAALPAIEGADPDALWREVRALAVADAERKARRAALEQRLSDGSLLEKIQADAKAEEERNGRLRAALEEERTYAAFVEEMARRAEDELLALLAPQGEITRRLEAAEKAAAEAGEQVVAAQARLRGLGQGLAGLESPYTTMGLRLHGGRANEILEELEQLKDGALPADRSARPLEAADPKLPPAAGAGAPAGGEGNGGGEQAQAQAEAESEQAFARELVRYFEDVERAIQDFGVALDAVDAAVKKHADALSSVINERKRRYACARELERRVAAGALPRSRAPEDLLRLVTRDPITEARQARDELLRRQDAARARRRSELERLRTLASLKPLAVGRSAVAARKAALLRQIAGFVKGARTPFAELPEVERKGLEYRAQAQMAREDHWLNRLLSRLSRVEDRERFEQPLRAFYLNHVESERVVLEGLKAREKYQELVRLAAEQARELAGAPEELDAVETIRVTDYRVARVQAALAAAPDRLTDLQNQFRKELARELPLPENLQEWTRERAANQLLAVEARLWGHRRWQADTRVQLSKVGIEAEIGRYRTQLARLEADQAGEVMRQTQLETEIARLRSDYAARARTDAATAAVEVLLIPALAWLLLWLSRRVIRRIEQRTAQPSAGVDDLDRRQRLKTLAAVCGAAFTGLVWVVATIYVLRRLGIDVTPIIASAGVVGLAVAFGAQALIKDFLSGFFILLENQFRVGDVVDLGGVSGSVEQITLRVTTLRDVQGTVHFVPNGILSRVSNMTQGWSRVVVEVGVSYGADLDRVLKVFEDALRKFRDDPAWRPRLLDDPVVLGVENLGESAVTIRGLVKTRPGAQWEVGREVRKRIKTRFDEEGIQIPFPQRVIHHVYEGAPPVEDLGLPPPPPEASRSSGPAAADVRKARSRSAP